MAVTPMMKQYEEAKQACPDALFGAVFSLLLPKLERRDRTMMRFELRQSRLKRRHS